MELANVPATMLGWVAKELSMFSALLHAFSRPAYRPELDTLEIRQWHTAHAVIVRVFGELWSSNIEAFNEAVLPLLDQPARLVVIDLTGVSFIGSQGLSAILSLSRRVASMGVELRVVAPPSPVRDAFEATQMHRVLKVYDTVASVLAHRAGTPA
jgi:anti-anti-sigma factor